ncbi:MAG TPA: hypothetical protein DCW74_05930 [Alteromonas australica]|uniref:Uncharacterized protein n=1 Tax=Alteromonas australica TaxID=589873 RepID=A0A350P1U5_9ALTE|nr:hypothetical protein [Alteromonas australica]|tara:strand:+ start:2889 stop:5048 length:2160 start_codon:yes stop_codon:yes gene_type:complete
MSVVRFGNTTSSSNIVEEISQRVPKSEQIRILQDTFPAGRVHGKTFYIGSLLGDPGQSLKINIDPSSPHFMQGQDFNGGVGIGGIVKILMEARGMKLPEIKEMFASYLDNTGPAIVRDNASIENPIRTQYNANSPYDAEYVYTNADGEVLVTVRRYNVKDIAGNPMLNTKGKPKKEFRPFVEGSPYSKFPDIRPLYNIPNIIASDRVVWVEGEKCADALNRAGYTATCTIGGAGALTKKTAPQFDFSPLQNKELILWPDNDTGGKKLADLIQDLALAAGAKSVTMLTPPMGKPEGWDAADALSEGYNIEEFVNTKAKITKTNINLLDDSFLVSRFAGAAPEQKFLIDGTFPLGVPILFAAAGDAGKGMMTLDMGMKVASGKPMINAFGGLVKEFGNVVIFTAEDDEAEMHRRVERLDPFEERRGYPHDLKIVSLPNVGGVFAIMNESNGEFGTTAEFEKIYEQILQMSNLKLIVFDPLASFVHADVNADPAAGAALTGLLARMATETGASVLVCHHMTKIKDDAVVKTPEQARNLIRGTTALVDGVRSSFAMWQVDTARGKKTCERLGLPYQRNSCFDGAVVKSNGPASRNVRHFVRDPMTGLLNDRTEEIKSLSSGTMLEMKLDAMVDWIIHCEREGVGLTHMSGNNGVYKRSEDADAPEILRGIGKQTLEGYVRTLQQDGRIDKFQLTATGGRVWLGGIDGPMSRGEYEAVTARDNV